MKPLTPASPHAIIMVGIPGSGKSTFAERFADTFQAPILNRIRLQKDLGLENDQADFLAEVMLKEYLKTRKTILIEGGTDSKADRIELAKVLQKGGYRAMFIWVQTDTTEARRRATKPYPQGSGLSADDFEAIIDHFETPQESEKVTVISGKHTYATQLRIVLKQIATNSTPQQVQPPTTQPDRGRNTMVR